jgi:hypothetical protein
MRRDSSALNEKVTHDAAKAVVVIQIKNIFLIKAILTQHGGKASLLRDVSP